MINVGIVGYGNLGRACEKIVAAQNDMRLVAVFSRRKIVSDAGTPVVDYADISQYQGKIDIMLMCGGSATDLADQCKETAKYFNTADTFDTHALMSVHFAEMDALAKKNGNISLIAAGWDPGLFSAMRALFESILQNGDTYTFWGKGVSQGHSEAIRKIDGVLYGIQYTVPKEGALQTVREGNRPKLTARDKHERVCYVVAKEGADKEAIKRTIVNMPNYFSDYDTTVNFITEEEFKRDHTAMPHGGSVMRSGESNGMVMNTEFRIKLQSNPDFTAGILVAYTRATMKMHEEGRTGAISIFDIPLTALSRRSGEEMIKNLL